MKFNKILNKMFSRTQHTIEMSIERCGAGVRVDGSVAGSLNFALALFELYFPHLGEVFGPVLPPRAGKLKVSSKCKNGVIEEKLSATEFEAFLYPVEGEVEELYATIEWGMANSGLGRVSLTMEEMAMAYRFSMSGSRAQLPLRAAFHGTPSRKLSSTDELVKGYKESTEFPTPPGWRKPKEQK